MNARRIRALVVAAAAVLAVAGCNDEPPPPPGTDGDLPTLEKTAPALG